MKRTLSSGLTIGIDPDVEACGLGIIRTKADGVIIDYASQPLPMLVDTIRQMTSITEEPVRIFIEAGWLNKGNWHINPHDSSKTAAAKGRQAGRNHQLGLDLCALLDHHGIQYNTILPLTKIWKGKDRKITHEELDALVSKVYGTGLPRKRSNQEERDALLIAWVRSGHSLIY